MSKLRTTTVEPEGATTNLDLGGSGDSVVFNSDAIKANTFKDAGGNTLWTSDGSGVLSSLNSGLAGGGMVLLNTTTITSSTANVTYTSDTITSDYDEYWVIGYGIRPATNATFFKFQCGSSFNTVWTNVFTNHYRSDGGTPAMSDAYTQWQAPGTLCIIFPDMGADETERSGNFIAQICDPTNTSVQTNVILHGVLHQDGGTHNLTHFESVVHWETSSALTDWRFQYDGGDIASGTFKIFGLE